jgi:hypothetical protein
MIGTLYQHIQTGEIYILIDVTPRETTEFKLHNSCTLRVHRIFGWGNFYEYFKPITEEK